MPGLLTRAEFEGQLRRSLKPRYVDKHPFMKLLYKGALNKKQVEAWIVNRFHLQNSIGSKDAAILSNCPIPEVRRIWISRAIRREGLEDPVGDVDGWLALGEAAGLKRQSLTTAKCLPGVRFAVNDLVNFARRGDWLEGISTSLYEVLAREELVKRVEAFKTHYRWIRPEGMRFFMSRLGVLDQDTGIVVDLVMKYAKDREAQMAALRAALRMSDVVWCLHDSIYMEYVIRDSPLSDSL